MIIFIPGTRINFSFCFARGNNDSDKRRWAYLIAYNRRDNSPVYEHFLPGYTPLHKVDSIMYIHGSLFLDGFHFSCSNRRKVNARNLLNKQAIFYQL